MMFERRHGAGALRQVLAVAACVCLLLAAAADGRAAGAAPLRLRCTNQASGASWPVVIDLGRALADSFPATVTNDWISWHDPQRGFFDLERATGRLRLRNASSTGGYFLYYRCRPE